ARGSNRALRRASFSSEPQVPARERVHDPEEGAEEEDLAGLGRPRIRGERVDKQTQDGKHEQHGERGHPTSSSARRTPSLDVIHARIVLSSAMSRFPVEVAYPPSVAKADLDTGSGYASRSCLRYTHCPSVALPSQC